MTSEEYMEKLGELAPEASQEVRWLIAHWDGTRAFELGLVGLRGPTLDAWIVQVRTELAAGAEKEKIERLVARIARLLEGEIVLSGAAVVQCGCLHTS